MMIKITKSFIKKFVFSVAFFIIAVIASYYSSIYIENTFHKPPIVKDLIWENLPYFSIVWLSEIFLLISVAYMFVWAVKKDINYIPYAIFLYSIFQIIRAGFIILTPLGLPNQYNGLSPLGEKSVFIYGAFPSGHLAYPAITYLITKSKIVLLFAFIVVIALLFSRAHYSIDLIGAVLLTFFIYNLSERYLKKYFIKNET